MTLGLSVNKCSNRQWLRAGSALLVRAPSSGLGGGSGGAEAAADSTMQARHPPSPPASNPSQPKHALDPSQMEDHLELDSELAKQAKELEIKELELKARELELKKREEGIRRGEKKMKGYLRRQFDKLREQQAEFFTVTQKVPAHPHAAIAPAMPLNSSPLTRFWNRYRQKFNTCPTSQARFRTICASCTSTTSSTCPRGRSS